MTTVTALPPSGEVVRPGNHTSTHSLAVALRQISDDLLDAPNRPIIPGEVVDRMSTQSPWIPVPVRIAA